MHIFKKEKPLHFERCWLHRNDEGIPYSKVARVILVPEADGWAKKWSWNMDYAQIKHIEIRNLCDDVLDVINSNVMFEHWICDHCDNHGDADTWSSYVVTERIYGYIEFHFNHEVLTEVYVDVYDKSLVTDNAMASRLIPACNHARERVVYPGWLADIAFARNVCKELLADTTDAPAFKEQLFKAIQQLDKLLDIS